MSDAPAGIYDIGYQHYHGPRLGRANAIRTVASYSFASAFGFRRGERAKIVPMLLLALVFLPAVIQVAGAVTTGQTSFINYGQHIRFVVLFLAIFAASQAPELVVADRQYGTIQLYLARALRPTDYALARLGALVGAFLVMTMLPELTMFVGKVFISAQPWQALADDWRTLGPIVAGSVLLSWYLASLGLLLASLSSRRAYGSAAVIAFFLLMPALSRIGHAIASKDAGRYTLLVSPWYVMGGLIDWLFGLPAIIRRPGFRFNPRPPEFGGPWFLWVMVGTAILATVALVVRYRRIHQ